MSNREEFKREPRSHRSHVNAWLWVGVIVLILLLLLWLTWADLLGDTDVNGFIQGFVG